MSYLNWIFWNRFFVCTATLLMGLFLCWILYGANEGD